MWIYYLFSLVRLNFLRVLRIYATGELRDAMISDRVACNDEHAYFDLDLVPPPPQLTGAHPHSLLPSFAPQKQYLKGESRGVAMPSNLDQ